MFLDASLELNGFAKRVSPRILDSSVPSQQVVLSRANVSQNHSEPPVCGMRTRWRSALRNECGFVMADCHLTPPCLVDP